MNERENPTPPCSSRCKRSSLYGAGLLVLAGVAVGVFFLVRGKSTPQPQPAPRPDDPAPAREQATSTIHASVACPGLSPEEFDRTVLLPLADRLKRCEGVASVHTTAEFGVGQIAARMKSDDVFQARQVIANCFAEAQQSLPVGVEPPVLLARDPDQLPIVWFTLNSELRPLSDLSRLAELLRDKLKTVPGVAETVMAGRVDQVASVYVDPEKLRAQSVTLDDVKRALEKDKANLDKPEEYGKVVASVRDGVPIFVRDVGSVTDSLIPTSSVGWNGRPAVAVGVYLAANADAAEVAAAARKAMADWRETIPPDVRVDTAHDSTADRPEELYLELRFAEGSSPEEIDNTSLQIEKQILERFGRAEVFGPLLVIFDHNAQTQERIWAPLRRDRKRDGSRAQVIKELHRLLLDWPHLKARVIDLSEQSSPQTRSPAIEVRLTGHDLVQLCQWAKEAMKLADKDSKESANMDAPALIMTSRAELKIDREKAAAEGVALVEIVRALEAIRPNRTSAGGKAPPYVIQIREKLRNENNSFDTFQLLNAQGKLIPLKDLVTRQQISGWRILEGHNGNLCVTITADSAPGSTAAAARKKLLERIEQARTELRLSASFKAE